MRSVLLLAALCAALFWGAGSASAHFGGGAFLIVPADHINPGETFEVIAADLTANATVSLTLAADDRTVPLGETVSDANGHFTTTLPLPADFPPGYAELVAVAADGTQASTWVLVGARTSSTPVRPARAAWWADPSVIVLGALLAGVVGIVGFALLRRRQPPRRPVAVAAGQRRRSAGKAQRRATRRGHG